jgi:hypothetical protein
MAARGKNNSKTKVYRKQTTKPTKGRAPLFIAGEKPLPNKIIPVTAMTDKNGVSKVRIPIPNADADYEDGRTVGWVVQARFVVKDKFMFVSDTASSATAMIKVPATHRDANVELRVMGEPEEKTPVIFQMTPYFVQEMAFGLGGHHDL